MIEGKFHYVYDPQQYLGKSEDELLRAQDLCWKQCCLNPKPTPNPKPQALNAKPQTLNPKPHSRSLCGEARSKSMQSFPKGLVTSCQSCHKRTGNNTLNPKP